MSVFSLRVFVASTFLLVGMGTAHAAAEPFRRSSEDLVTAAPVPVPNEGVQVMRVLVGGLVGLLPAFQPRSFETAPVEHPWVMWLPEAHIDSSWFQMRSTDRAVAVSPFILNGGARSAASAGFVFGFSY